jgi:hypothetical protein
MLRNLRYRARVFGQRLFSLVLIPAFLCGTLPHTACICADGHREQQCRAIGRPIALPHGSSAAKCHCCSSHTTSGPATIACCHSTTGESQSASSLTAGKSCCQPIVEGPASAIPAAKRDASLQTKCLALAIAADGIPPAASVSFSRPTSHPSGPPPLDAVIVYLHLTI